MKAICQQLYIQYNEALNILLVLLIYGTFYYVHFRMCYILTQLRGLSLVWPGLMGLSPLSPGQRWRELLLLKH